MKSSYYVHLEMFYNRFNQRIKRLLDLLIPWVSLILFVTMAYFSVKLVLLGIPEKSPSIRINMGFVFISMLVLSSSICYYLWIEIRGNSKKPKA